MPGTTARWPPPGLIAWRWASRVCSPDPVEAAMAACGTAGPGAWWRVDRDNDTPRTVYHLHGWLQILSPAVLHALAPVRDRLVISAHDFFLACPNGAFADLRSGAPCPCAAIARLPHRAVRPPQPSHKLLRVVRHAIQTHMLRGRSAPCPGHSCRHGPLLARGIRSGHDPRPAQPGHAMVGPRIAAEDNREVLFVGRLEETKGPDLAAAAAREAGCRCAWSVPARWNRAARPLSRGALFRPAQPGRNRPRGAQGPALVMPSRYPEPYGLVAMEAARSGLPVVLPSTALLAEDLVATAPA
jgi:glycosyltransferase involved in cell wall biosynthesis